MTQEKKIQIKLRESVSIEKEIMDYLSQLGPRTGEPKRLLIEGYKALKLKPTSTDSEEIEPQAEIVEETESKPFFNLAVKG
ncbi:hypothetical protein ACCE85_003697 [Photobacterium damselae]